VRKRKTSFSTSKMTDVGVQTLDIRTPQFGRYHNLQVPSGAIQVVISPVQDAILEEERVPVEEEYTCFFRKVVQTFLWRLHATCEGLDNWQEAVVSSLGGTDVFQSEGRRLGSDAEHVSPCRDVIRRRCVSRIARRNRKYRRF